MKTTPLKTFDKNDTEEQRIAKLNQLVLYLNAVVEIWESCHGARNITDVIKEQEVKSNG